MKKSTVNLVSRPYYVWQDKNNKKTTFRDWWLLHWYYYVL